MAIQHKNIPDDQQHEPKGASSAASDTIYVADGSGSGSFRKVPRSSLQGLTGFEASGQQVVTDGSGGFQVRQGFGRVFVCKKVNAINVTATKRSVIEGEPVMYQRYLGFSDGEGGSLRTDTPGLYKFTISFKNPTMEGANVLPVLNLSLTNSMNDVAYIVSPDMMNTFYADLTPANRVNLYTVETGIGQSVWPATAELTVELLA